MVDMVVNVNHAVIISVNWIFDSNDEKSLPLTRQSLDIICSSLVGGDIFDMFKTVLYAVRYVNTKSKLNLSE